MPDMIRHPWIAGAETPDLIRGRNDNAASVPVGRSHEFRKHQMTGVSLALPAEILPATVRPNFERRG